MTQSRDTPSRHVGSEEYAWTDGGLQSAGALARRLHRHVRETSQPWRDEWERLAPEQQERVLELLDRVRWTREEPESDELPAEHLPVTGCEVEQLAADIDAGLHERRLVRRALAEMLRRPAEQWARRVERANRRFGSRLMAELMLEECRRRVRDRPREAAVLAGLVPRVVQRIPGSGSKPWAAALCALATGHEANALRVAGDLPAADRLFAVLGHEMAREPVRELGALAELASLEASLRIGQRRVEDASHLLERAALLYRNAGEGTGEARTLIQRGNLLRTVGRTEDALACLASAATVLDAGQQPYLFLCTVTGRVNALCDLDRPEEAAALLDAHAELFETSEDLHSGAILRALHGQVSLGLGDYDSAAEWLFDSSQAFLDLGRGYDAALAAFYLAEVHVHTGDTAALENLVSGLVRAFRTRQVERETLATLQLLAQATQAREVTIALLADLRQRLLGSRDLLRP